MGWSILWDLCSICGFSGAATYSQFLPIQIILATDFNNYVRGDRFRDTMNSVLGDGVFTQTAKCGHSIAR
ncbi:hypothetical protein B0H17DRAFT_1111132 [Mycena rosella]|uniref:Uncharacterized protein n=1 Tax=Mycena rosella TaxID=1033263 RepID=A0AAD7BML3_MYCRO|nr:hypothetical protein B0H17DRAFT_1111132 [Mycena rosella]